MPQSHSRRASATGLWVPALDRRRPRHPVQGGGSFDPYASRDDAGIGWINYRPRCVADPAGAVACGRPAGCSRP